MTLMICSSQQSLTANGWLAPQEKESYHESVAAYAAAHPGDVEIQAILKTLVRTRTY